MGKIGLKVRGLGRDDAYSLLRWGPMAVADFANEWFETEALRAMIAARGVAGIGAGPWSGGTTANLLLHAAASGGNGAGSTVFVKGGIGAVSEALAAAAKRLGATIRTGAEVARLTTKDGRVNGVVLAGGEELPAKAVVSGTDPQRTLLQLLDPALLDPEDLRRIRNYQQKGMASKVNLALNGLPTLQGRRRAPTSSRAGSTSAPASTTSSAPSTPRSTATSRRSRTSTSRSRRSRIRRSRRPAAT